MKIFWIIVAAICGVCAAAFLLRRDVDSAFIVAAAGAVAWFLSYRVHIKSLIDSSNDSDLEVESTEVDDDQNS